MSKVDPEDDSIRRWVVQHYRYDPHRRQRRHVLVSAFDDEQEFEACMRELSSEVEDRRRAGPGDRREHVTGTVWEPGHLSRAATGHMVRRAIEHGADPSRLLVSGELPHNMTLMTFDDGRSEEHGQFSAGIRYWHPSVSSGGVDGGSMVVGDGSGK